MTDKKEVLSFIHEARSIGGIATAFFREDGTLDGVFYMNSKSKIARYRSGAILGVLSFAEMWRVERKEFNL